MFLYPGGSIFHVFAVAPHAERPFEELFACFHSIIVIGGFFIQPRGRGNDRFGLAEFGYHKSVAGNGCPFNEFCEPVARFFDGDGLCGHIAQWLGNNNLRISQSYNFVNFGQNKQTPPERLQQCFAVALRAAPERADHVEIRIFLKRRLRKTSAIHSLPELLRGGFVG